MSIEHIHKADVLQALSHHIGQAKGIKGADLTREITRGTSDAGLQRRVRKCIEELRLEGAGICGKPDTGYFMAETVEELEATRKFLFDRANKGMRQVAAMKNLTLPDLAGQLHLKT